MVVSRRVGGAWAAVGAGLLTALALVPLAGRASPGPALTGGCSASVHIDSQWGSGPSGGETLTVTVVNTSPTVGGKWTVTWRLASGQAVVNSWNATLTASDGVVTAVNAPYNGTLAPGASTTFGAQLSGTGQLPTTSCDNDALSPPTGSPSATPSSGADVTVTATDSYSTVTLLVGQTLGVSLPGNFKQPAVSGAALTSLSSSGGYPTTQPVSALYRAVAPGQVDVSSQTDAECLHATPPCAIAVALWVVHVRVVAPSSSGSGQTVEVTTADNHGAVNLHVGDQLLVNLVFTSPPANWTPPKVTPAGVLAAASVAGGYPTDQPVVARYVAVAAGQADLSSLSDIACNHAPTPCPSPQVSWTVHVTVS